MPRLVPVVLLVVAATDEGGNVELVFLEERHEVRRPVDGLGRRRGLDRIGGGRLGSTLYLDELGLHLGAGSRHEEARAHRRAAERLRARRPQGERVARPFAPGSCPGRRRKRTAGTADRG